jgi:hypothetical protein
VRGGDTEEDALVLVLTGTAVMLAGCGGSGAKRTADSHRSSAPSVFGNTANKVLYSIEEEDN